MCYLKYEFNVHEIMQQKISVRKLLKSTDTSIHLKKNNH